MKERQSPHSTRSGSLHERSNRAGLYDRSFILVKDLGLPELVGIGPDEAHTTIEAHGVGSVGSCFAQARSGGQRERLLAMATPQPPQLLEPPSDPDRPLALLSCPVVWSPACVVLRHEIGEGVLPGPGSRQGAPLPDLRHGS